jgi:hypothetical protein
MVTSTTPIYTTLADLTRFRGLVVAFQRYLTGKALSPCPSKIMLSDTTSALSISKGRAPVRGLRSKTCPFIVVAKLAVPVTFCECFLRISHFAS